MKILLAMFLIALPGCAGWNNIQGTIADRGAAVSDEVRDSALFLLCKGITIGSWAREFGNDPKRADAWRTLCSATVTQNP